MNLEPLKIRIDSSMRGPRPPALVCPMCDKSIHAEWEHPFLAMAKQIKIYDGPTTGGVALCEPCNEIYTQRRVQDVWDERFKRSGLPVTMQGWTIASYPDQKSPYVKQAHAWLDTTGTRSDLVLFGPPGTGKTGLSVAMLRMLLERRRSVKFVRAADLVLQIRDSYRVDEHGKNTNSELKVLQSYLTVSLLVIDDLTALRKSEFFDDTLLTLLDVRQKDQLPTIVTVNLLPDECEGFFGPLLHDRLRESAQWWYMDGRSLRKSNRNV